MSGFFDVSSRKSKDFTAEFIRQLPGTYVVKKIDGGTVGNNIPVCKLGLYKKTDSGEVFLGHSMGFAQENCTVANF